MKNLLRSVAVVAVLSCALTGCTGAGGLLTAATNAATGGAGGTTPGSTAGTTPTSGATTGGSTTTTTTGGTSTPTSGGSTTTTTTSGGSSSGLQGPGACTRSAPSGNPTRGYDDLGAYANQLLPDGWADSYKSEDQVTNAIDNLYTNDWPCFQKFYPGAATVYKQKRGIS